MKGGVIEPVSADKSVGTATSARSKKATSSNHILSSLTKLPDHRLNLTSNGHLEIFWQGREVAKLDKEAAPWPRLGIIDDGWAQLAQYLDEKVEGNGFDADGNPNVSYAIVAARWTKRASREFHERKPQNSYLKRHSGKLSLDSHGDESKKASEAVGRDEIVSRLMSSNEIKIKIDGLENSEAISQLMNDIHAAITSDGSVSSSKSSAKLEKILRKTLSLIKNEFTDAEFKLSLPDSSPASYIPRQSGKASDFLKEHYGAFIEAGVCFRPDVKRLDPKLEMALTNEFRGRTDELRAILPTKADEVDARIESELGGPVRPENRKAARAAASYARQAKR